MDTKDKQIIAKNILMKIKNENMFTECQTFEEFIDGLCARFARIYGEFLPRNDYVYIVKRLKETEIL